MVFGVPGFRHKSSVFILAQVPFLMKQSNWLQSLEPFLDVYLLAVGGLLAVGQQQLFDFNSNLAFTSSAPLPRKRLLLCCVALDDSSGGSSEHYSPQTLLLVARQRGLVINDDDWTHMLSNITCSRGLAVEHEAAAGLTDGAYGQESRETQVVELVEVDAAASSDAPLAVPVEPGDGDSIVSMARSPDGPADGPAPDDVENQCLQLRLRNLGVGNYNLARQLKRRDALIKKLQEDIQSLKLQKKKSSLKKGSESRFFSAEGGLQLAVRHNATIAASCSFGISAGLDVHATNITRWQQKLRACRILEFRCWSSSLNAHRAEAVWQQQGLNITLRRFRQDATKSNSWKGKKLSVTELLGSAPTKPVLANMSWECVSASVETMCIMADLKPVVGLSTGKSVLGIVDAQVGSVICDPLPWLLDVGSPELLALTGAAPLGALQDVAETLVEVVPEAASPEQALVAHGVSPRQSVRADLDVWCCCTDNGPDISCSRNLVASAMALNLWSWWFDIDCLAHQYQLLSLLSLQPTELSELLSLPTSYYSCLAIVMHLL